MNTVFKLMAFSIMLNFAVGIMLVAVVDKDGESVFDIGDSGGLSYDDNYTSGFVGLEKDLNPSSVVEDSGNALYRLLDTLTLGFISKFLNTIDNYMFGFINMLKALFDSGLRAQNPTLANMLFGNPNLLNVGVLKSLLTVAYIIGAFSLWTGKNLDDK